MHIVAVGLNHRTAPVELRERVSFAPEDVPGLLQRALALPQVAEAAVLSTCNRSEIYACVAEAEEGCAEVRRFFCSCAGEAEEQIRDHLYAHLHASAARHLFRVACGIDSMIVGEAQILSQVKQAFRAAEQAGALGPHLRVLFQHALRVGKLARSRTEIGRGALSVSSAAVELARDVFEDLSQCRALVVGAGEMGELTLRHLIAGGVAGATIASRTFARAQEAAERVGGVPRSLEDIVALLAEADIVISQTSSPEPIITREHVRQAIRGRRSRPLLLIDIAVPRDVEPAAGELSGVFLFDIDDLQTVVAENFAEREREIAAVERLVSEQVEEFSRWMRSRDAVPLIQRIEQEAEQAQREELERALRKIPGLTEEQAAGVEEALRRLKQKLLFRPLRAIRELSGRGAYRELEVLRRALADDGPPVGRSYTSQPAGDSPGDEEASA